MATATKKAAPKPKADPQPSDAERVIATAANPSASRVGVESIHQIDGCPLTVTVTDGARATLSVDKHDPLTQAELATAVKLLNAAIQETY